MFGTNGEQTLRRPYLDRLSIPSTRKATATAMVAFFVVNLMGCAAGERKAPTPGSIGGGDVAVSDIADRYKIDTSEAYDGVAAGTLVPVEKTTLNIDELRVLLNGGTLPEADSAVDMEGDKNLSYLIDNLSAGDTLMIYRILDKVKM